MTWIVTKTGASKRCFWIRELSDFSIFFDWLNQFGFQKNVKPKMVELAVNQKFETSLCIHIIFNIHWTQITFEITKPFNHLFILFVLLAGKIYAS